MPCTAKGYIGRQRKRFSLLLKKSIIPFDVFESSLFHLCDSILFFSFHFHDSIPVLCSTVLTFNKYFCIWLDSWRFIIFWGGDYCYFFVLGVRTFYRVLSEKNTKEGILLILWVESNECRIDSMDNEFIELDGWMRRNSITLTEKSFIYFETVNNTHCILSVLV